MEVKGEEILQVVTESGDGFHSVEHRAVCESHRFGTVVSARRPDHCSFDQIWMSGRGGVKSLIAEDLDRTQGSSMLKTAPEPDFWCVTSP